MARESSNEGWPCEKCGRAYVQGGFDGCPYCEVKRLRLERDMLALNPCLKDPVVFVVTDAAGDVAGVVWEDQRTGSQPPINYPSYYDHDEAADAAEGGD